MNDLLNREKYLQQLLNDNFMVARYYRKTMESFLDRSLKQYFQSLASKRSQFAIELGEEIKFYGGEKPYNPPMGYDRKWTEDDVEGKFEKTSKCVRLNKESLEKYQEALSEISDGSLREILIRHKAFVKNCIVEFEALKSLLKYDKGNDTHKGSLREESSQF